MKVLYGYGHLQTNNMIRWSQTIMPRLGTIVFSHRMGFALVLIFIISVIAGEAIAAEIDKPGILATVLKWLPLILRIFNEHSGQCPIHDHRHYQRSGARRGAGILN